MILTILLICLVITIIYGIVHSSVLKEDFTDRNAILDSTLKTIRDGYKNVSKEKIEPKTENTEQSLQKNLSITDPLPKDTMVTKSIEITSLNNLPKPSYEPYDKNSDLYELQNFNINHKAVNKYNGKELYSIIINGLTTKSASFTKLIETTLVTSCELLKLKKDYNRISECVVNATEENAGMIYRIITRAYSYTISPKYNENKIMDPYLVNSLNKNIKNIIEQGREVILTNSNSCSINSTLQRPC